MPFRDGRANAKLRKRKYRCDPARFCELIEESNSPLSHLFRILDLDMNTFASMLFIAWTLGLLRET